MRVRLIAITLLALAACSTGTHTPAPTTAPRLAVQPTPTYSIVGDNVRPIIDQAAFDAIKPGMTYQDVAALIGGPGFLLMEPGPMSPGDYAYVWYGIGSDRALVLFHNHRVIDKGWIPPDAH